MRDVTDSSPKSESVRHVIIGFLKHPIRGIAHLPNWSWARLFWIQFCGAAISGVLAGLTRTKFFAILGGLILTPIVSTIMVSLLTAFLYYHFQVFEKRTVPALKIFCLAVFSSLPFFVFQIASGLVPPVTLVGFAFSSLLLAVGLTENFLMEKKRAVRLSAALFGVVALVWIGNKISLYRMDRTAGKPSVSAPDSSEF